MVKKNLPQPVRFWTKWKGGAKSSRRSFLVGKKEWRKIQTQRLFLLGENWREASLLSFFARLQALDFKNFEPPRSLSRRAKAELPPFAPARALSKPEHARIVCINGSEAFPFAA